MKPVLNFFLRGFTALTLSSCILQSAESEWIELINDSGLSSFRAPLGDWNTASDAKLDPSNEQQLKTNAGAGLITNGSPGKTKNIFSTMEHGDIEAHIEFMIPKKANSGIYFMGRYEVQVYDSHGVEDPRFYHCGGIYERHKWPENYGFEGTAPRVNAALPAGEWQTYHIIFHAPRFDQEGNKIKNAVFVKVVHNGTVIHENQEVTGPTRAAGFGDEKPLGPLMIQGDHGPVAYRSIRIKPLQK